MYVWLSVHGGTATYLVHPLHTSFYLLDNSWQLQHGLYYYMHAAVPFSTARWSFAGFVCAMAAFDQSNFAGIIYIIGGSFWAAESVWSLWCMKDVSALRQLQQSDSGTMICSAHAAYAPADKETDISRHNQYQGICSYLHRNVAI